MNLEIRGKESEEMQERRRRPRRRSNFRRFGVELGNRANSVPVTKTGGLENRGLVRLRCRAREFGRIAGEIMEENEEVIKLEKKEMDDGKGATLG